MSSPDVSCPDCKNEEIRTERISLANGGHHIKASCASCGRFIKFLPHDFPRFYFGKHRIKTVIEVAAKDPSYLKWCLSENFLREGRLKDAVEEAVVKDRLVSEI